MHIYMFLNIDLWRISIYKVSVTVTLIIDITVY